MANVRFRAYYGTAQNVTAVGGAPLTVTPTNVSLVDDDALWEGYASRAEDTTAAGVALMWVPKDPHAEYTFKMGNHAGTAVTLIDGVKTYADQDQDLDLLLGLTAAAGPIFAAADGVSVTAKIRTGNPVNATTRPALNTSGRIAITIDHTWGFGTLTGGLVAILHPHTFTDSIRSRLENLWFLMFRPVVLLADPIASKYGMRRLVGISFLIWVAFGFPMRILTWLNILLLTRQKGSDCEREYCCKDGHQHGDHHRRVDISPRCHLD